MSTTSLPKTERGLLVAAVRQLLADGWQPFGAHATVYALDNRQLMLRMQLIKDWLVVYRTNEFGMTAGEVFEQHANSIPQALSHLVVEGILPRQFAFWAPPLPVRPMHDPADCPLCSGGLVSEVRS